MNRLRVYVVLEHARGKKDCRIHGVYVNRQAANRKALKICDKDKRAVKYMSVLSLSVKDYNTTCPNA